MFKARPSLLKTPLPFLKDLHRAFLPPFTSHHLTEDTDIHREVCTQTYRRTQRYRYTQRHDIYTHTHTSIHKYTHKGTHTDTPMHRYMHTQIYTQLLVEKKIYCLTTNIIRSRVRPSETQP